MGCNNQACRFENATDEGAAQLLVHSEASLNAIIENADMTMYSLDRKFRYTHFNSYLQASLKQVYGVDIKIGDVIFDFLNKISSQEAKWWYDIYSLALDGQKMEFVKEFKFGNYHAFFKFHLNPIKARDEITGLACVAFDITKERLAEIQVNKMAEDLVKRNHDLEQYSYIIAHNLRGPIANLLGIANLLEMPDVSDEDKEEAKSHILNSTRRLDDVIKDLSYILQGKEEINQHRESVRFDALVDEVSASLESVIGSTGAIIATNFDEQPGMITVNAYVHSIFYNLISNGIKFSKPGTIPLIKIRSKKMDGRLLLTFEDNGLGFDLEACGTRLFGLYKRFHPEIAEGKGMGLFMVRTHVETLGGDISVKSEVGKGTIMTIRI